MTEGELRDLTFSHRAARLVMAGVGNGTFEALADTPRTAQEIAAACGMAERGACALLEALAALGLVERCGAAFVATPEAKRVLTEKGERSRRHTVLHDLWHTGLWTRLEESLASGLPLTDRSDDPFFTRPDVLVRFFPNLARAMAETSRLAVSGIIAKHKRELCMSCLSCLRVCPFGSPFIDKDGKISHNEVKCMGCGICAGICPAKAFQVNNFRDDQIIAMIVAAVESEEGGVIGS